jgi:hypothetical protein
METSSAQQLPIEWRASDRVSAKFSLRATLLRMEIAMSEVGRKTGRAVHSY